MNPFPVIIKRGHDKVRFASVDMDAFDAFMVFCAFPLMSFAVSLLVGIALAALMNDALHVDPFNGDLTFFTLMVIIPLISSRKGLIAVED